MARICGGGGGGTEPKWQDEYRMIDMLSNLKCDLSRSIHLSRTDPSTVNVSY